MTIRLRDIQLENLEVLEIKNDKFLSYNKNRLITQTPWITINKFGLSNKQYVLKNDTNVDLLLPISEGDEMYVFLKSVDNFIISQKIYNGNYNGIVKDRDDNKFIKIKLDINRTEIYIGDELQKITTVYDFYNYIKYKSTLRILFSFGKIYKIKNMYGITLVGLKVQVEPKETKSESMFDFISGLDN